MSPIKELELLLVALNDEGTFSEGDAISGTLVFRLKSDTKVKSISVKAKGDANVHWSEGSGDDRKSYDSHRRYFKLKEYLVEKNKGTVLPEGVHKFNFTFRIPPTGMPSSFRAPHGKIIYQIEGKISRSWRWPSEQRKEIQFVSKSYPRIDQAMAPQSGNVTKELGTFSKGKVQMSASVNKGVCCPGDTLSAYAKVCNTSSKSMKPKFSLHQKTVHRAEGKTNTSDKTLFKMVGETIEAGEEVTVTCEIKVPDDVTFSLFNCDIISSEYYIKVYLDISFAFDPEVVFPLLVVPRWIVAAQLTQDMGPQPAWSAGAPSISDFLPSAHPPPAFPPGSFPPPAMFPATNPPPSFPASTVPPPAMFPPTNPPPPAMFPPTDPPPSFPASTVPPPAMFPPTNPPPTFPPSTLPPPAFPSPTNPVGPNPAPRGSEPFQYPAPHPTQPATTGSGFPNQWPQTPPSTADSSPARTPAQNPTPTAPPLFQSEDDPPSYTSLFLPSSNPLGQSDQKK